MSKKFIIFGRPEVIWNEYRDSNGSLTNASNPRIDIFSPTGIAVVNSASPSLQSTGIYYYNFNLSSTALAGEYQIFWSGSIGCININQDEPRYIYAITIPIGPNIGSDFINQIRRMVGDDDPDDYQITTQDIIQYIKEGAIFIQNI